MSTRLLEQCGRQVVDLLFDLFPSPLGAPPPSLLFDQALYQPLHLFPDRTPLDQQPGIHILLPLCLFALELGDQVVLFPLGGTFMIQVVLEVRGTFELPDELGVELGGLVREEGDLLAKGGDQGEGG